MKSSKKLLVALLVFTMLLSTVSVGFAADVEADAAPAVVRAQALGILKGDQAGNLNLDKPITRAEALALVVRILGLESSADLMTGMTQFPDVTNAHWASGYVNLGVGQKIVNGYPDGSFKPEGNVTYAEMAKMLLHAMNYGGTLKGSVWPAGVMGKADDLDLFDDVNAAPDVPAIRGDVVQMIDNSLTVKHLVQKGYGDLEFYEEGEDTFLSKLKVKELKDIKVSAVDTKKSRITLDRKAYKVIDSEVDVESLLGVEVTVWANNDDEVFFIDPDLDSVRVDVVKETVASNDTKVKLKIEDKSYRLSDDIEIYVNGDSKDSIKALEKGLFGYFILDDNDRVIVANLKKWDVTAGVVTDVDTKSNIISYFLDNENEDEIDLDDEDDYIIRLDGKVVDIEDVEENDVLYAVRYNDTYHIQIVRDDIQGEVDRIKDDKVTIDGKTYSVVQDLTTYSTDKDKKIALLDDTEKIKDMVDEEAYAILDIAGDLRHITSEVKTTSDDIYGVVTRVDEYNERVRIYANGSTKSYELDGKIYKYNDQDNAIDFDTLKSLTDGGKYAIVEFSLNKDGEIVDLFVLAQVNEFGVIISGENYAGSLIENITIDKFNDKHDTISTSTETYFVTSNTVFIDEIDDMDIVEWDDFKDKEANNAKALLVRNNKYDVKLVIFQTDEYAKIAGDDDILAVVLDKYYQGGDWKVKVAAHGDDEEVYVLSNRNVAEIGETIKFNLTSKNEIKSVTKYVYGNGTSTEKAAEFETGKVTSRSGSYIEVNNKQYRVDSATLLYDVTDGLKKIEKASLSDLKVDRTNVSMVVAGRAVKVLYILGEDVIPPSAFKVDIKLKDNRGSNPEIVVEVKDFADHQVIYADLYKGDEINTGKILDDTNPSHTFTGLDTGTYKVEILDEDNAVIKTVIYGVIKAQ